LKGEYDLAVSYVIQDTKMDQKWKTLIGFLIIALLLGGSSIAYSLLSEKFKDEPSGMKSITSQGVTTSTGSGQKKERLPASDFKAVDQNGNQVTLSSLFGKPLVLNFWASWCPPCKAEMPEFNTIYKDMKSDVTFVMVDMIDGQRETMEIGKAFIKNQGYEFPVYYDTMQEASAIYEISAIPTTLIIDKNGMIVDEFQGRIDEKALRAAIELAKIT